MPAYTRLLPGDPAPWFHQRSSTNPRYAFDTVAGRYVVLCFFGSAADDATRAALQAIHADGHVFDDTKAAFFAVSSDPADEQEQRISDRFPGFRVLWDHAATAARLYGALPADCGPHVKPSDVRRLWIVLDPTLRVIHVEPFEPSIEAVHAMLARIEALPPAARFAGFEVPAPILVLPNVFEREFCRRLIDLYESHGGEESGFMRQVDGKTVLMKDPSHKRRRDHMIEDPTVIESAKARFVRRVIPEIEKAHQFKVTRMERYIVSCYDAADEGHFRAHRDNTTSGTAHRRFAVSVNLNEDFEGGMVSFPEYGPRTYKAPPGGAVVFSCSLLHAVSKVTAGRRYAFLPFLYDEAAAKIREANNESLGAEVARYKAR